MKTNVRGGCICGSVRFSAPNDPKFVSRCHCASCRSATGAAFSTWIGFEKPAVTWTKSQPSYFESSKDVQRGFCKACGTPLTYEGHQWADEIHLLIGTFDNPSLFVPTNDAFKDEALPWMV